MTTTATNPAPPPETLESGLNQALAALGSVGRMEFGEQTFVRSYCAVHVDSEAEVDRAAALLGVKPRWVAPGHYRAERRRGAVTVAVDYIAPARSPMALSIAIDVARAWASNFIPGSAA